VFVGTYTYQPDDGIVAFSVNSDGSLTPVNSTQIPTKATPRSLVAGPSGKYLYALSDVGNSIDAFTIDTISGSLTPLPGSPRIIYTQNCNPEPTDMSDLYGRFLYTTDVFGSALSAYAIAGKTGFLTKVPGSPYPVVFSGVTPLASSSMSNPQLDIQIT
jgi:6-phosphogluconolactonase